MNCIKCGAAVGEGDRFCMACGNPIVNETVQQASQPLTLPYAAPVVEGANVIIPAGRKFRIVCPSCHSIIDNIKQDDSAGYPCSSCGSAYAYGGQVLLYRMGNPMPQCAISGCDIIIDGVNYGHIKNRESVRIMLSSGVHTIGCTGVIRGANQSNQFQINITPESCNYAFKLSVIYGGPTTFSKNRYKLDACQPEEIPDI